jgi:hypothetical protein
LDGAEDDVSLSVSFNRSTASKLKDTVNEAFVILFPIYKIVKESRD